MIKCSCGGQMRLSVRIVPKPYEYKLVCCTCGESAPADGRKAREAIGCAIEQALARSIKDGVIAHTQEGRK